MKIILFPDHVSTGYVVNLNVELIMTSQLNQNDKVIIL